MEGMKHSPALLFLRASKGPSKGEEGESSKETEGEPSEVISEVVASALASGDKEKIQRGVSLLIKYLKD